MGVRARLAVLVAIALFSCVNPAAAAEHLVLSLHTHRVLISSNFTGTDVVLFGAIERDAQTPVRKSPYDIVVTVTGPRQDIVVRRKARVFGIWVNVEQRTFVRAPSYLSVLANRPFDKIAPPDVLRRNQVGLQRTILPQMIGPDIADTLPEDPMRKAFLRLESESHLYHERTDAVTFLTPYLFRAAIPMPANVTVGNYDVDVKLFAEGQLVAQRQSAMEIIKVGFEQFIASAAHDQGLLYGLATMMMALLTGWLASIIFRRD